MGEEVSDYIGRLVPAMQAAYGAAWNIAPETEGSHRPLMTAPGRSRLGTPISSRGETAPWVCK